MPVHPARTAMLQQAIRGGYLPGYSFPDDATPALRPLVNRCKCGQQISNRRLRCLACQNEMIAYMARKQIEAAELAAAQEQIVPPKGI